jgi:asparagine synthase (glutamine-hydrolysing)
VAKLLLARATARRVKVVLSGEGADEIFGGYPFYRNDRILSPLSVIPAALRPLVTLAPLWRRRHSIGYRLLMAPAEIGFERFASMINISSLRLPGEMLRPELVAACDPSARTWETPDGFSSWHRFNQLQYFDLTLRLPDLITRSLDRTTMAASVEARVPFLDHELFELAAGIPPRLKMKWLREKYILRRAMEPLLPPEITWRAKRPLAAPTSAWLRRTTPDFVREAFSPAALTDVGIFEPAEVARLLASHRSGEEENSGKLMAVLLVDLWHRRFVSRSGSVPRG